MTVVSQLKEDSLGGHSPETVRRLVTACLVGGQHGPLLQATREEEPEDFVVVLLRDKGVAENLRQAAVSACKAVGIRVFEAVQAKDGAAIEQSEAMIERWCNVMDRVAPEVLRPTTLGILQAALCNEVVSKEVRVHLIRAALRFRLDAKDKPFWGQLLDDPHLCAYGFNALHRIDPADPALDAILIQLWRKQLRQGWPVDAASLTARVLRAGRPPEILAKSLVMLKAKDPGFFSEVISAIRKSRISRVGQIARFVERSTERGQVSVDVSNSWRVYFAREFRSRSNPAKSFSTPSRRKRRGVRSENPTAQNIVSPLVFSANVVPKPVESPSFQQFFYQNYNLDSCQSERVQVSPEGSFDHFVEGAYLRDILSAKAIALEARAFGRSTARKSQQSFDIQEIWSRLVSPSS